MTITNEVINKTTSDYNLFLLLKQNMINGEIKLPNLSSKNRSLLHRVCYNYGLEHFSTGNYTNRIIIIKDSQHTYFSIPSMTFLITFTGNLQVLFSQTYIKVSFSLYLFLSKGKSDF